MHKITISIDLAFLNLYQPIQSMRHVEFFHIDHFQNNYHRVAPPDELKDFIDFFWETKFDDLWEQYPNGFSDALFSNVGYTYLINLGTPFVMQVEDKCFEMRSDGFLPRHRPIECYHKPGNKLFGIKFKVSPVMLEKKINFSEYKEYIFPLSYLMDPAVIGKVKTAKSFEERIDYICDYFETILRNNTSYVKSIRIVTEILERCYAENDFCVTIQDLSKQYNISTRTLQRYFEAATSTTSKEALQIMRIRKATQHLATSSSSFHYSKYGYYDHSHFYKHLKQFLHKNTLVNIKPHLKLLQKLHTGNTVAV